VRAPEAPDSTLPARQRLEGAFRLPRIGREEDLGFGASLPATQKRSAAWASATRDNCPATAALSDSAAVVRSRNASSANVATRDVRASISSPSVAVRVVASRSDSWRACKSLSVVSAFDNEPYFLASACRTVARSSSSFNAEASNDSGSDRAGQIVHRLARLFEAFRSDDRASS